MTIVETSPPPPRVKAPRRLERTFRTFDGAELFYRAWLPAARTDKALVLFHRGHEHSGRFDEMVEALGLHDAAVFAWDARGHGRSPGDRGYADSFATLVCDADEFVKHVAREHHTHVENKVVLGHSGGEVIVVAW